MYRPMIIAAAVVALATAAVPAGAHASLFWGDNAEVVFLAHPAPSLDGASKEAMYLD